MPASVQHSDGQRRSGQLAAGDQGVTGDVQCGFQAQGGHEVFLFKGDKPDHAVRTDKCCTHAYQKSVRNLVAEGLTQSN